MAIDLNKVAKEITLKEGKKHSLKIGDVKEVLRLLFKNYDLLTISAMWVKFKARR